jgi:hypothetical protein
MYTVFLLCLILSILLGQLSFGFYNSDRAGKSKTAINAAIIITQKFSKKHEEKQVNNKVVKDLSKEVNQQLQ